MHLTSLFSWYTADFKGRSVVDNKILAIVMGTEMSASTYHMVCGRALLTLKIMDISNLLGGLQYAGYWFNSVLLFAPFELYDGERW